MKDYPIVDVHTHTYPNRDVGLQALRGTPRIGYYGTIEELLPFMEKSGIDCAAMLDFTPTGGMRQAALGRLTTKLTPQEQEAAEREIDETMLGRVRRRNLWACSVGRAYPHLLPYIGVDHRMTSSQMQQEIEVAVRHGAKGLKVHPPHQKVLVNDPSLFPAYAKAQEIGLPILFHAGRSPADDEVVYAQPRLFDDFLPRFPHLVAILAHLGRDFWDETLYLASKYPTLYFDCCGVLAEEPGVEGLTAEEAFRLFRRFGPERILFGSDWPFRDPNPSIRIIQSLDLREEEKRMVLGGNALRLLGLGAH